MLGAQFGGGGRIEQLIAGTPGGGKDLLHFGTPEGERAGLVEHDGVDRPERLEMDAALDDGASRAARPMPPRMASGVPAAMPQAPATMITEMVEAMSCVIR